MSEGELGKLCGYAQAVCY